MIFLRFCWPTNYLRSNTVMQFLLDFFNGLHFLVVSQIICLPGKCKTRKPSILLYIMNLIWSTNYTSCILWHAYQLATSQVKSQLKTIRKWQNWTSTLSLQHWILQGYIENLFPVNLPFLVCLLIVIQMCFLNYRHQEICNQTF